MLVEAMSRKGFKNCEKEWWHFTLEREPYPDPAFDFPITPRAQGAIPAEVEK
jgi:zinc D-Ala-D-Ala dipeptidase